MGVNDIKYNSINTTEGSIKDSLCFTSGVVLNYQKCKITCKIGPDY
jgi:hypothetical protein